MIHCPQCPNQPMNAVAAVAAFLDPPEWSFWGAPGARAIRHRGVDSAGRGYVHFVVQDGPRTYHRLAYGITEPDEVQPGQPALFEVKP